MGLTNINGTYIDMELDTGSGVSVIPKSGFENYFKGCKLNVNISDKHVWSLLLQSHFVAWKLWRKRFEKLNFCSVIMARKSMKYRFSKCRFLSKDLPHLDITKLCLLLCTFLLILIFVVIPESVSRTLTEQELACKTWACASLFLFDLTLYVPSTIFQLNRDGSSWVEPVLS